MAQEAIKYIFANAVTAALIKADVSALYTTKKRDICRTLAIGFGLSQSNGDAIFKNSETSGLSTVNGFGIGSYYNDIYEQNVRNVFDATEETSGLTNPQKDILTLVIHAIIFGYAANPNITEEELYTVIGNTLGDGLSRLAGINSQVFEIDETANQIIHPFTGDVIRSILAANDYSITIQEISSSPRTFEQDLVHYNWYDTSRVFLGPNLDTLKDSENQYYYISGKLIFSEIPTSFIFCEEETITFDTPTGAVTSTYFKNEPCVDSNTYIGPRNNIKFFRVFNDGPYSSGNFSSDVKTAFINFDKERLNKEEYYSNASNFYTFNVDASGDFIRLINSKVLYDINGEYNLVQEYQSSPIDTGCLAKYQTMRVGDVRLRSQCLAYDANGICISCVEQMTTGFKFALAELDYDELMKIFLLI
jgi:hypothetical protein